MSAPQAISGLSDVAGRYDAAFVDVWGVIHNGRTPFTPALEACRRFRAERGPVILVSNAPRPSVDIPGQLMRLGAGNDFFDAIVTSGDATHAELVARAPGPVYAIGPSKDERLYDDSRLDFVDDVALAAFISCTGPVDEDQDKPEDYDGVFKTAVARGIAMVCANPDIVVHKGDRLIICAGALARRFEQLGGAVVHCGKPYAPIYRLALAKAAELAGRAVEPGRVLAIGDGPDTDIAGANAQGLPSLFIAGGIHQSEVLKGGALDAAAVSAVLARTGRRADFAMAALVW